jgi:hypothetical protein
MPGVIPGASTQLYWGLGYASVLDPFWNGAIPEVPGRGAGAQFPEVVGMANACSLTGLAGCAYPCLGHLIGALGHARGGALQEVP